MDSDGNFKAQTLSQGSAVPYSEGLAEGVTITVAYLSVKGKGLVGDQEVDAAPQSCCLAPGPHSNGQGTFQCHALLSLLSLHTCPSLCLPFSMPSI